MTLKAVCLLAVKARLHASTVNKDSSLSSTSSPSDPIGSDLAGWLRLAAPQSAMDSNAKKPCTGGAPAAVRLRGAGSPFNVKSRTGIPGTLHRISAAEWDDGRIANLTYRIGRHIEGKATHAASCQFWSWFYLVHAHASGLYQV